MDKLKKKIGVFLYNVSVQLKLLRYNVKRHLGLTLTLNDCATIGEQLRYGQVAGPKVQIPAQWGASEVVKAASGRFVKTDGSGRLEIAGSGDTQLIGHATHREETTSSTEGGTKTQLNTSLDAVYKIPLLGAVTLTRAMFYDTCDLIVTSTIQGADLTSVEDVLVIVDGDVANQKWVMVMLNPNKMFAQGIT